MKNLPFIFALLILSIFVLIANVFAQAQDHKTIFNRVWQSHQPALQTVLQPESRSVTLSPKQNRQGTKVLQRQKTTPLASKVHHVEKLPNAKKILFIGDFVISAASDGLNEIYANNPNYLIVKRTQGASGLVRDAFYNWHDSLIKIVAKEDPDIVIFGIGANDRQSFKSNKKTIEFGDEEWNKIYQERINIIIKDLQAMQKPWLWIGIPSFGKIQLHHSAGLFNSYFNAAIGHANGQVHKGQFIDLWNGFVDEKGGFALSGYDMNGNTTRLRTNDGINFTQAGRQKLAFYIKAPLEAILNPPVIQNTNNNVINQDMQGQTNENMLSSVWPMKTMASPKKVDYIAPTHLTDLSNNNLDLIGNDTSPPIAVPLDKHIKYEEQKGRADYFVQP